MFGPAIDPMVMLEIAPPGPGAPPYLTPDLWMPLRPLDIIHQHLNQALVSIAAKRPRIDSRWDYYVGRHSEKVLTRKFQELWRRFTSVATMFTNYCSLTIDAPLARLSIVGWQGKDTQAAQSLWEENDLDLDSEEVHKAALCAGETYIIVWPRMDPMTGEMAQDENGAPIYDLALQDARNMHVHYASRRRRDRQWAVKVWLDVDRWRAIVYYPEEIVRLTTLPQHPPAQCPVDPDAFLLDDADPGAPHAFGAVPVVRFSRTFDGRSRLDDVIPVQDRVNKLIADKVVAAEFGAFPQRWVLSNDDPPENALRAGPGGLWVIPPASTSDDASGDAPTTVGQFASAELSNYDNTIQQEVNALFTIAQLPRHLLIAPGVAPSAQAILADEAPMVAAVRGYLKAFSAGWRDVMELAGLDVEPVWEDIEVHNELTAAQTLRELTTSGMPLDLAARIALDLPQEDLDRLAQLPVPPQPGAALPGQNAQAAPQDGGTAASDTPGASSAST